MPMLHNVKLVVVKLVMVISICHLKYAYISEAELWVVIYAHKS